MKHQKTPVLAPACKPQLLAKQRERRRARRNRAVHWIWSGDGPLLTHRQTRHDKQKSADRHGMEPRTGPKRGARPATWPADETREPTFPTSHRLARGRGKQREPPPSGGLRRTTRCHRPPRPRHEQPRLRPWRAAPTPSSAAVPPSRVQPEHPSIGYWPQEAKRTRPARSQTQFFRLARLCRIP